MKINNNIIIPTQLELDTAELARFLRRAVNGVPLRDQNLIVAREVLDQVLHQVEQWAKKNGVCVRIELIGAEADQVMWFGVGGAVAGGLLGGVLGGLPGAAIGGVIGATLGVAIATASIDVVVADGGALGAA